MASSIPQPVGQPAPPPAPRFRDVFDQESSYVWRTLQRLGVHDRDLEDVAHEVFITVHRRLGDYDPSRPLRPWLFGIALRTAMRYRELARHRREVMNGEVEAVDERPAADEQLDADARRRLVADAIAALDEDLQGVLLMHEIDGEPMPVVAEALEIPLNTAYSRLRRARERFHEIATRLLGRRRAP